MKIKETLILLSLLKNVLKLQVLEEKEKCKNKDCEEKRCKMKSFRQVFEDYEVDALKIGFQRRVGWKYVFENGYGASVIDTGYGDEDHPYEIAVLKRMSNNNYSLCYSTPITDDVIGYLTNENVIDILNQIKSLEAKNE